MYLIPAGLIELTLELGRIMEMEIYFSNDMEERICKEEGINFMIYSACSVEHSVERSEEEATYAVLRIEVCSQRTVNN